MAEDKAVEANISGPRDIQIGQQEVQHGDIALKLLEESPAANGIVDLDSASARRVLRKIDYCILPIMAITNMLQFLDKTTLSYAALFGVQEDLHLHGTDYSWLSSIFYFGYLTSQPISGVLLQRFPAAKCLAGAVFIWSAILFMHVVCNDWGKMMAVRFFLGVLEGLVTPAFVLISTGWYPRKAQPFRMGFWFSFNGTAQVVGGILAYGLGHIHVGGIEAWKWMFLVTGAMTTVWSVALWFLLPNSQLEAWFLKDDEKRIAVEMVRDNNTGIYSKTFKREQLIEGILDPKTWMLFLISFLINVPNSVASFGNLVISGFGFGTLETTLLAMPAGGYEFFYIFIATLICARFSNSRTWFILLSVCISLLGSILVLALPYTNKAGLLAAYYIVYSYPLGYLLLLSLVSANTAGHTKKVFMNAMIMISYSIGNIAGPQFYKSSQAPRYRLGIGSMVVSLALLLFCYTFFRFYLMWLNKRREPARLAAMASATGNIQFMDLTDKENPLFVYAY